MKVLLYGNHSVSFSSESHHAASLEALGHEVIRMQEPASHSTRVIAAAEGVDLFVWIKTHGWDTPGDMLQALQYIKLKGIPTISYHLDLYMGLQRWEQYRADPYLMNLDHFFTVDRLMADWLNENTSVKGHYLPAAVFGPEAYMADTGTHPEIDVHPFANDVIFVGQRNYHPEWKMRPTLVDWLESTYGDRFTRIAGDQPSGTVRGEQLNRLYADSKIAVGDSLCIGFDYPDYVSDRYFEAPGRGAFQIFPRIKGLDRYLEEDKEVVLYDFGDFDQLKSKIDYYLTHDAEREAIRLAGHERVKREHTYRHRWADILKTLELT